MIGAMPFTVRPDMMGIAFQTTGVFVLLQAIESERPTGRAIALAFAAFGLAICVKQHLCGGVFAGLFLVLSAWWRGRVSLGPALLGILTTFVIVVVYYVAEEVVTGGLMSQAVFVAAAATAERHPADWGRAAIVVTAIVLGSRSLIAFWATAGLAQIAWSPHAWRGKFARAGLALVGFTVIMPFVQAIQPIAAGNLVSALALYLCLGVLIPACALLDHHSVFAGRLDRALCLFVTVEAAIVACLCRASTGAWINYGIQGIVFAAILAARSLARASDKARSRAALATLIVVSATTLGVVLRDAYTTFERARVERLTVARALEEMKSPSAEIYFAGRADLNRLHGQIDLVHDDWLYPVFEAKRLAEARSMWLELALSRGSTRFVVSSSDAPRIDGLDKPLGALGYVRRFQVGSFHVWERPSGRRRR